MAIRDRGKMKWQGAFFMPEHVKMLGDLRTDYNRTQKPELDEYQYNEFDERISGAMEENTPIKVIVWQNGFEYEKIGLVHYLDTMKRIIHLELSPR